MDLELPAGAAGAGTAVRGACGASETVLSQGDESHGSGGHRVLDLPGSDALGERRVDPAGVVEEPLLIRLLCYYVWSIVLAIVVIGLCCVVRLVTGCCDVAVAKVTLYEYALGWVFGVSWIWIRLPVIIAAWVVDGVVAPEDPWGPQTAAWSHAFWLVEFLLIAILPYGSFRLFRSRMTEMAIIVLYLCLFDLQIGFYECYSFLS